MSEHVTNTSPGSHERRGWLLAVGLTAFLGLGATVAAVLGKKTGAPLVFAVGALVLLTLPYMAFLSTACAGRAQRLVTARPAALLLGTLFFGAVYVFYGVGTGTFGWVPLVRVVGFAAVPALLALSAGHRDGVTWQDLAIVACIWLPFNFGLLDSIWEWPEGQAAYVLNTPMAIDVALLLFVAWRRLPDVPLRWQLSWNELKFVGLMLLLFMALSLPFGLLSGFLTLNPQLDPTKLIGQPLGIFFFIAIPEELLFRGLLLGLLTRRTGRPAASLIVSSVLFGVSHWHEPGLPDFRYLGLAAVAGIFYGATYQRSRSLIAPALLHTAVDTIWSLLLHT